MGSAQFDKDEVLAVISQAGSVCSQVMTVYLVGGGAMAMRGDKDATKDVDLILEDEGQARALRSSLEGLGFEVNVRPPLECRALTDASILTSPRGMRVDLFVRKVCNKLSLSSGMKARSQPLAQLGPISLRICSREDLFLLKSVTERSRDLDDMVVLYRKGIDGKVLIDECREQGSHDALGQGRIWEAFLLEKVEEMEERYGTSVPWKKELKRVARSKLGRSLILENLQRGSFTASDLGRLMESPSREVWAHVSNLEADDLIWVDRSKRPYVIHMRGGRQSGR